MPCVRFGLANACVAIWADPGAGKTTIVYKIFSILKKEKMARHMVVIAPLRPATETWPTELEEWTNFKELKVVVLHGDKKNQLVHQEADIYVITPEAIQWFVKKLPGSNKSPLRLLAPEILCVDESSKFKNTNSTRFKQLRPHLRKFMRRITLTGTPAPNGYIDIFGQVYLTDLGQSLGEWVTHFRNKYFDEVGFMGHTYVLRDGAEKAIQKAIKPVVYRVDSSSNKVPILLPDPVWVELPKAARSYYDDMEEEFFAELDSGDITTAVNGAVASGKCGQIANGGLWLDEEHGKRREHTHIHDVKTEAVLEICEELNGKQMLIAYDYVHDFERLQAGLAKQYGERVPFIGGGVSPKRVREIIQEWNRGNIQFLLGHPKSMGHGLNMQKSNCQHICWHSPIFNLDDWDQMNKRICRQGNKAEFVFCHLVLARNTVDIAKWSALQSKSKVQGALLDALRRYRKSKA